MRVRHHCVEGWSAVAAWHGVQLREIAKMVGASRDAQYVEFRSFDNGYYSTWDIESSMHPQTILAYGMNGRPLYPDHGAPLRLYSPVKLGYKMREVPDRGKFPAEARRRVLGRSGLRLVRRRLVERGAISETGTGSACALLS